MRHSGPNARGCNFTCTNGWIRGHGQWVQCPNHRMRRWPIGPMPPPVKTRRARALIREAKAVVAEAQERDDLTDQNDKGERSEEAQEERL